MAAMKKWIGVSVFLLVLGLLLRGQTKLRPTFAGKGTAELDAVLRQAVERGAVPGVVAVVGNREGVVYEGAFGLRDVARRKPMPVDAIFRIASMAKPVTSVAAMMLIEEGKLGLDDPVSKYMPQFKDRPVVASIDAAKGSFTTKKAVREVAIRHLLTHTSGLAYTFANEREDKIQKALKPGEEPPLLFEPGSEWTYGGSTKVLGQIVEKISGMPLDRFFEERIFRPLQLQDASYAVPAGKMDRVPTTHERKGGKLVESPNPEKIQWAVVGDGGLNASAQDYVRFLTMFLDEGRTPSGTRLLRKESVDAMTSNQIGDVVVGLQATLDPSWSLSFPIGAGRDKFGFGFQIGAANTGDPDLRTPGSYSWSGIFNTHFWVDPKRGIAAAVMMQVLPFYDAECMKVYRDFEAAVGRSLR
jgi:CubicO group peptidase (beta-lactamase class C family)